MSLQCKRSAIENGGPGGLLPTTQVVNEHDRGNRIIPVFLNFSSRGRQHFVKIADRPSRWICQRYQSHLRTSFRDCV